MLHRALAKHHERVPSFCHLFRVSLPLSLSVTVGTLQAKHRPEQVAVFSLPSVLAYEISAGLAEALLTITVPRTGQGRAESRQMVGGSRQAEK